MAVVVLGQKEVKRVREFTKLEALDETQELIVSYSEVTLIDDVEVSRVQKMYARDYAFWKASEIGQIILGMIGIDLSQEDPAAPREVS